MMAAVVCFCFCLLLRCSFAAPTSSLAAGRQDGKIGGKATGKALLCNQCSEIPSAIRGTDELDVVLDKRTSRSPSHHRLSPPLQSNGLQQALTAHPIPLAPFEPHVQGGPDLRTVTPPHVPANDHSTDGYNAAHHEPGSSSVVHYKVGRRPRGSLQNDRSLKAKARRENHARTLQRIKDGVLVGRKKPDGSRYAVTNMDEYHARKRESTRRSRSKQTKEAKARIAQQTNENAKRLRAKRKAQREAEQEGRSWQGSPVRKPGRPRKYWDDEQEQAQVEAVRQHEPTHLAVEEAPQRAMDVTHAPPAALSPRPPESSSVSWPVLESLPRASFQRSAPGSVSSMLHLGLSLSAPGSSTSGQRQMTDALPAARTREEEVLPHTFAPPGQHDSSSEHDRLRLTLAPPKND